MTGDGELAVHPEDLTRLRRVLLANFGNSSGAVVFLLVVHRWAIDSGWLLVLAGLVAVVALVDLRSWQLARRGRAVPAVVTIAVATWVLFLPLTAIAPVSALVSPITLVPPVALAGAFVTPRVLRSLLAAMTAFAVVVIVEGRVLPGTGLEALASGSPWVIHVIMLFFIPSSVAMVSFSVWCNHHSLWGRAQELARARQRLGSALMQERRMLERDLHDGAQQLLIAASLQLRVAGRLVASGGPLEARLAAIGTELVGTVDKLRVLAHGLYPAILTDRGIGEALRVLPGCEIKAEGLSRQDPDVEAAVYFCCDRILRDRDADAPVRVSVSDATVARGVQVVISGAGRAPSAAAVEALADRAAASGGSIALTPSEPGGCWALSGLFGADSTPTAPTLAVRPLVLRLALFSWAGSAVLTLVLYLFAARNAWLLLIVAGALVGLLVTSRAGPALRANQPRQAAWWVVGPFIASAVLMTALDPLTLYYTPSTLLIGVLLVVPTASHRMVPRYVAGACLVSVCLVVLGRFQSWTGLRDDLTPGWTTLVVVLMVPAVFVMFSLVMWFNYIELWQRAVAAQRSTARLVTAADDARRGVADELDHGPLASLRAVRAELAAVPAQLDGNQRAASALADCRRNLAEAAVALERLGAGLFPSELAERGLAAALTPLAAIAPGRIRLAAADVGPLPLEMASCLYFCCSEAVQNALKHSGDTSTVVVTLSAEPGGVWLEVRDDGAGFSRSCIEAPAGQGFANMADRLRTLGGTLTVHSDPGVGTVVSASLPR